ncbi:hypothetical protein pipiens_008517 [Culex pipiens pipiens]|uniref:Cytochrome P450 n=1 Tax=Culex pipiens pipiens TaxID=38569 RepID=A0ABD1DHA3_CULPP
MIAVLLICSVAVLGAIALWLQHRIKFKSLRGIPTVEPCYPLVGNVPIVVGKSEEQLFSIVAHQVLKYDRLFKVWVGPKLMLATSHPDLIYQVVNHPQCLERPFLYGFSGFTKGIFSTDWKLWKLQRKALNPAFNALVLNNFVPIFEECSRRMVQGMLSHADGSTGVNILKFTSICTLEMICATSLGSDVMQRPGKEEFVHSIETAFNCASKRMFKPWMYTDLTYRLTKGYKDQQKAWGVICDFFSKIIEEKKQQLRVEDHNHNVQAIVDNKHDTEDRKPKIFIDRLLAETRGGVPFSDQEIFDNTYHIITLGNDTSALEVMHASLFLAMNPEIQRKVYDEFIEVFPSEDSEITAESLNQLEYLDMFLKECLRHCPTAANIARTTISDIELDGMTVPAGTDIILSFYGLHHRKDVWGPDVDKFDPENFRQERVTGRHPHAFLPFSHGTRNCLGARYATLSIKVMLIYILRKFHLSTTLRHEDLRYKFDMTLKLAFDSLIQLERRDRQDTLFIL